MSFHDAELPEDVPDYEYEREIARLTIATTEGEDDDAEK